MGQKPSSQQSKESDYLESTTLEIEMNNSSNRYKIAYRIQFRILNSIDVLQLIATKSTQHWYTLEKKPKNKLRKTTNKIVLQ